VEYLFLLHVSIFIGYFAFKKNKKSLESILKNKFFMTTSTSNSSEIRKCDACGKVFPELSSFKSEQDKKVAQCFISSASLEQTRVNVHGLCLLLGSEYNLLFSEKDKRNIQKPDGLPSLDRAIKIASKTFFPNLDEKINQISMNEVTDLVTFFEKCESENTGLSSSSSSSSQKRKLDQTEFHSYLISNTLPPKRRQCISSSSSSSSSLGLCLSKIEIKLIENKIFKLKIALNNGSEFIKDVLLEELMEEWYLRAFKRNINGNSIICDMALLTTCSGNLCIKVKMQSNKKINRHIFRLEDFTIDNYFFVDYTGSNN
jgi:hypothetical protein